MKTKVLLTGIAGSIGCHIYAYIMENTNWEVIGVDSFRHKGYKDRLRIVYENHPEWIKRTKEYQTDLVCPLSIKEKPDIILHLAALSDVFLSTENPQYVIKNNIDSTLTMLEYARTLPKLKAFVYFSTDEVYGPVKKGKAHKEWSTHRPSNPYAASKAACEDLCYAYWRSYGIPLVITNTMNNFGEMQSASKFPVIIQNKLERGEIIEIHSNDQEIGTRYYIHSRNVADALLWILKKKPHRHKIGELDEPDRYHIVGSRCLSNLDLARKIAEIMGKPLRYKLVDFHKNNPAHDIHYGLEDNKLRPSGWKEPVDFETSLKNTIEWQTVHKEWLEL